MPEMPMSGVRSQLLPLQGALSTRSLAPAASTLGWLASMARAGSLTALGRYGVGGAGHRNLGLGGLGVGQGGQDQGGGDRQQQHEHASARTGHRGSFHRWTPEGAYRVFHPRPRASSPT